MELIVSGTRKRASLLCASDVFLFFVAVPSLVLLYVP
jgi:hypothetical protein